MAASEMLIDENWIKKYLNFDGKVISKAPLNSGGCLSNMIKLEVENKEQKGDNITVVIKCMPADNDKMQQLVIELDLLKRETSFYSQQHLPSKLKEHLPKIYSSVWDEENNDSFIVMEKIQSLDNSPEFSEGFDIQTTKKTLDALACFHSISLEDPKLKSFVETLPNNISEDDQIVNMIQEYYPLIEEKLSNLIPDSLLKTVLESHKWIDKLYKYKYEKLREKYNNSFDDIKSVQHGDFWLENVLLTENNVYLIDFQFIEISRPFFDLALFFTTSLNYNLRKEYEIQILEYYTKQMQILNPENKSQWYHKLEFNIIKEMYSIEKLRAYKVYLASFDPWFMDQLKKDSNTEVCGRLVNLIFETEKILVEAALDY